MTLDEVMREILNDRDIFDFPYDRDNRTHIVVFNSNEWTALKKDFETARVDSFKQKIEEKKSSLEKEKQLAKRNVRWPKKVERLEHAIKLTESLENAWDKKPHLLRQLFDTLNSFGELECHLPNMDDYGRVVENYKLSIVESYFLDKINATRKQGEVKALRKLLEYVKKLYGMKLDTLEIAFFVRKLNSLKQYTEVLRDE